MNQNMPSTVTIYGASDDLIEFEGAIYGEVSASEDDVSVIVLAAPDGGRLTVEIGFCSEINSDGWGIRVAGETGVDLPCWPMWLTTAPGHNPENDPALIVQVPAGTTATFDGEAVR